MRNEKGQFVKGSKLGFQKGHPSFIPLPIILNKICLTCGKSFSTRLSNKNKKVCSLKCRTLKHLTGNKFKVNKGSWNKGLEGYMSGEKNGRWIKDRTLLKDDHKDRGGQLHREWSNNVKNRDKWTCRIADVKCNGRLEAHHILSWSEFPELRYQINNGITLCHTHHPRTRVEEKRLSPYFMELVSVSKE